MDYRFDPRELHLFLEKSSYHMAQRAWIHYGPMEVYVRRGHHNIWGDQVEVFDIANIVVPEEHQGMGIFKEFVQAVKVALDREERRGDIQGIFVENVLTRRFQEGLEKMGFERMHHAGDYSTLPHYYLPLRLRFGRAA